LAEGRHRDDDGPTVESDLPTNVDDDEEDASSATQLESPAAFRRVSGELDVPVGEHTSETLDSHPPARPSIPPTGPSTLGSAPSVAVSTPLTTSPVEAMHMEEIQRTRNFLLIVYAFCVVIPSSLPFLGGSNAIKIVLVAACAVCAAVSVRLHLIIRDPARYTQGEVNLVAFTAAVTAYMGVFYWGVFSVAPAIIVMGLYFFSRSQSLGAATFIYGLCAALQLALTTMILMGVFQDPGLFPVVDRPLHELILTQVILQFIYLCTYLIARWARRTTLQVIDQLQVAMRQVQQREALLQEARHDLDAALRVGGAGRYTDQTVGSFKLGTVIGRGAMGEVYDAVNIQSAEPAAVKLLHPNVLENPSHVARFLREAEVIGQLSSPHVVKVLERSDPLVAVPYLAMERLWGDNLAHHLRAKRRLSIKQLVKMAHEVGSVIDLASKKGVVHRDLKPQNLLLHKPIEGGEPIWKILDFGVSKLGESSGTLTRGHVVGTPVYMAPEQARSDHVDHRADLYALAAVCYRCLTGRPPFSGKDVPAILYSVVYEMPPKPSEMAELHVDLDYVLAVGMAKAPADRFANSIELATAIELAADGRLDEPTRNKARVLLSRLPWGAKR